MDYNTGRTSVKKLNTELFDIDGISPSAKLIANWTRQLHDLFESLKAPDQHEPASGGASFSNQSGSWGQPARSSDFSADRADRAPKRSYNQGPIDRSENSFNDRDYLRQDKRPRDAPLNRRSSEIPSLLNLTPAQNQERRSLTSVHNHERRTDPYSNDTARSKTAEQTPEQVALQLIAATMELSGGNSTNAQSVFNAFLNRNQTERDSSFGRSDNSESQLMRRSLDQDRIQNMRSRMDDIRVEENRREEEQRRIREDRIREERIQEERIREERRIVEEKLRQEKIREERAREERRREEQMREERIREEMRREKIRLEEQRAVEIRRREEEMRLKQEAQRRLKEMEDNRLREVQIAAKLAMEQQKIFQEQQNQRQAAAARLQEQQAQMTLMAVTRQFQEQIKPNKPVPSLMSGVTEKKSSVLDRINEKLKHSKTERERDNSRNTTSTTIARYRKDSAWNNHVVLFSFTNRNEERKPLRGVTGPKNSASKVSDCRSQGLFPYTLEATPVTALEFLKIKVKIPGDMNAFETKVASYNNRLHGMAAEYQDLLRESRTNGALVRREGEYTGSKSKATASQKPNPSNPPAKGSASSAASKNSAQRSGAKSVSNESKARESANPKVVDLRDSLLSKRLGKQGSSKSRQGSEPPAIVAKPRWDKSDESDDDLIWDDDEVPIKPPADEGALTPKHEPDVDGDRNTPTEAANSVKHEDTENHTVADTKKQECVFVSEDKKGVINSAAGDGNAIKPSSENNPQQDGEKFVTLDETT